jgi:hypothetical protein
MFSINEQIPFKLYYKTERVSKFARPLILNPYIKIRFYRKAKYFGKGISIVDKLD